MQGMNDNERLLFMSEMSSARKNRTTGLVLTLFLGGIGAHRFYLNQPLAGALYLLFCWTFVPAIVACVELFLIMSRVDRYNDTLAMAVATRVRILGRPAAAA
jgi:TM2 domain-containing membrane protein YozV